VPAHQTLLYPFVDAADLDPSIRDQLATTFRATTAFDFELTRIESWPDALYVLPTPASPFEHLAARLGASWPEYPIYGGETGFAPHITIAEPAEAPDAADLAAARRSLPAARRATTATLIAEDDAGQWRARWRFPLGRDPGD
jgi:2'-5' RNA ligase